MNSSWDSVVNATMPTAAISRPVDPFHGPLGSIEPWNFKLLATVMFFVTFLSLSENFIVLLVTYKYKQLRQPLNYIILNLSLADFLVSAIGGSLSFITNLYGYFVLGVWACVLEGFAVTFLGIVALWSLAVLAFERYFVICRPLGHIRLQGKHAALGIIFIWVFSFIWTIPPTIGWSSYTVSPIGTTCEPNWYSREFNDHTYIFAFFTTCFIMPLLVIFVSYGKLMRKLRKVSSTQGRLGAARKPEKQVTRMVIVMILAFLFCWCPYAAFSITVITCPDIELDPRMSAVPAFFSKTATVYNPVIYVFMNRQFRKCVLQMFSLNEPDTNPTTERPMQGCSHDEREMSTIARMKTSYSTTTKHEECSKRDTFAQLPIPEDDVCPM
ncbi:vertebrate ancient long opsin a [Leucoraja erinacea]|uniref:vertebrate ancient long opsin a n=1 Tax=Leucoraja erinaceus TaxID=7782 RepID=UPI002458AB68|nr:vertebrate ancient long opsin a [Leucoraja erinacea]